ncbi:MAG: TolC family protein [Candidatus Omnitrophota bacterium]|nr:MAG: TolC family protein [Candidatus Omnitrophota bacterium]
MRYIKRFIFIFLFCTLCLAGIAEEAENELSLGACIIFAAQNSFEVKLARLDFLVAETGQGIAESIFDTSLSLGVGYSKDTREALSSFAASKTTTNTYSAEAEKKLPTGTEVNLSFSNTRESSNSAFVSSNPAHSAEAALEIRQPLAKNAFGYVDRRSITLTSLAIENSDLDRQERIEVLFADVEDAYWEWVFSRKAMRIYNEILEKARNLHESNTRNYDIGIIEKGDFLASGANVLIREKDLLLAENAYRSDEEQIKLLMNLDAASRIHPSEILTYREIEVELGDCLRKAFLKRRDYQQAKTDIEIENITLETKANERWPEIDLTASMVANGIDPKFSSAVKRIGTENNADYSAGVEISIPLENNLARSEFEKAKANKEKAILTMKKLERSIVTEVGDAFRDYIMRQANVDKLLKAAQLQEAKLKEEEKRFKFGRSNTKRLIDYQQDYLNAQLDLARSMLELKKSKVDLEESLNVILEKYEALL